MYECMNAWMRGWMRHPSINARSTDSKARSIQITPTNNESSKSCRRMFAVVLSFRNKRMNEWMEWNEWNKMTTLQYCNEDHGRNEVRPRELARNGLQRAERNRSIARVIHPERRGERPELRSGDRMQSLNFSLRSSSSLRHLYTCWIAKRKRLMLNWVAAGESANLMDLPGHPL